MDYQTRLHAVFTELNTFLQHNNFLNGRLKQTVKGQTPVITQNEIE